MTAPALRLASEALANGLVASVRPVTATGVAQVFSSWLNCRREDPAAAAEAEPYIGRFCDAVIRGDRAAMRSITNDLSMALTEPEPNERRDLA